MWSYVAHCLGSDSDQGMDEDARSIMMDDRSLIMPGSVLGALRERSCHCTIFGCRSSAYSANID